ncbi:ABC transporter substrate-binding protein [Clostridium sp. D5]|uniref:ABC transporter substrate-binding protein n=1 Tax=Clostridium sp. D5 TaxID=556261 RepID=UPI0001FC832C|nr:ABC transporter substrate-binding protein [Clostridium sp. D5]EGB91198.1 putative bacterial extracellular solute-binding protein [Clostridium sp. D5]
MKNRIKRTLVFMLALALTAGLLAGCSKGNTKNNNSGKGRYIEKDIELPLKDGESVISLSKSKDGNPLLFAGSGAVVNRYEYKDGKWEESPVKWIAELYQDNPPYLVDMEEAADGTQVVLSANMETQQFQLARGKEGGAGEALDAAYLKQETEYGTPAIADLLVDDSGNYWLQDMYQQKVVVLSPDTLEMLNEIETVQAFSNAQKMMAKGSDGIVAVNTEEGVYTLYQSSSMAKKGTLQQDDGVQGQLCSDGTNWYSISEDGISRKQTGNDISEILMEGSMGAMGSPVNSPISVITGNDEDFYVLYSQDKAGTKSLEYYSFDSSIPSVPEKTLKVFGLSENDTVRQAIISFQKKHTDVKVEFNTSGKSAGEVSTDDIRTLNTELLGGNGADVLLLDGLPVDSYIEKGMLEDLTDLANELMGENTYLEAILKNTAQKDEKIYGMPVKFKIPILYGDDEVKTALESIDTLQAYMDANPEATVFGVADYDYISNFLFQLYQEEIVGLDGKIDQDKLAQLLELEAKISENARAEEFQGEAYNTSYEYVQGSFNNIVSAGIMKYPNAVSTDEISSVQNMMLPYAMMRELNVKPSAIQNMYDPVGVVGINESSEEKELAEEFVKYLFSEEIQSAQLDDGFPVMESALESMAAEADSEYAKAFSMMSSTMIGDEVVEISATYPTVEEVEQLMEISHSLTKPVNQDRVVWNIYQETTDKYLEGSIDATKAAETIAQKVDTYLAE